MSKTVADYTALITREHADKPKFIAMVEATATEYVDIKAAIEGLPSDFDVDNAVGALLDIVGMWVGVSRVVNTPISGVYFTWGDAANPRSTGWNYGSWKGAFDPSTGIESLPDDAYRTVIKARISANQWDGTVESAYSVWKTAFSSSGSELLIQDNQDMSMIVGVAGTPLSGLNRALLTGGYFPLKPSGVGINYYALSVIDAPLFGWGVSNSSLDGWGTGAWPDRIIPA